MAQGTMWWHVVAPGPREHDILLGQSAEVHNVDNCVVLEEGLQGVCNSYKSFWGPQCYLQVQKLWTRTCNGSCLITESHVVVGARAVSKGQGQLWACRQPWEL